MSCEFGADYVDYQLRRSWLRRQVRKLYLHSAASKLSGPTLDFGCGLGELLELLPAGSQGLEYNLVAVAHCRKNGLRVDAYDGAMDNWHLSALPILKKFESMVISHVLEHLDDPMVILHKLLSAAAARDIRRVLVIVPGSAGYDIDPTHRTFINLEQLADVRVTTGTSFQLEQTRYFPGNWRSIGDYLSHHELQAIYGRGKGAT